MAIKHGLVFLALVCVQAAIVSALPSWVPPEIIDMVQDDKKRCMDEHGTQESEIQDVAAGKISNARTVTCYMFCLLEAFSLVDEDGVLDTDMLLGLLPDHLLDTANSVLGKCTPQVGADACEKLYNLAVCVYGLVPDLWFIV